MLRTDEVGLNLLTVVNAKVCQPLSAEERSSLDRDKAMFTPLLLDDFLDPGRPLVHQVPAADAAIKSWVDLNKDRGLDHVPVALLNHCLCVYFFERVLTSLIRLSVRLGRPAM